MEARPPAPSLHSVGTDPRIKELGLVILTCLFLSLAELTERNIKVLIVLEIPDRDPGAMHDSSV